MFGHGFFGRGMFGPSYWGPAIAAGGFNPAWTTLNVVLQ